MNLREKIARAIAQAQTDVDPDTVIIPGWHAQMKLRDGSVVVPTHGYPLYQHYLAAADAALGEIQKSFEAAGIIIAWSKD
jgi:hypothetical protein